MALVLVLRSASRGLKVALPGPVGLLSSTIDTFPVWDTAVVKVLAEMSVWGIQRMH